MAQIVKPDLCVIGAGAAGLGAALAAKSLGASVILVERGKLGGARLHSACIPSKALIETAAHVHGLRLSSRFGIANDVPKINFRSVHEGVDEVVRAAMPETSLERLQALGVEVVQVEARFVDRGTLEAGDQVIRARRFVIATGGRAVIPPIPGLQEVPYFTSETIFANTRKLTHLVIIGGGWTGVELGQAFRRLGSEVSIIETGRILSDCEPDLVEIVRRRLLLEGVQIHEHSDVLSLQQRSMGIGVTLRGEQGEQGLDASHILLAAGRTPMLDGLDLERARIARSSSNAQRLQLSGNLRTTNRRVYAVGEASGLSRSSHEATRQGELAARHALVGQGFRWDRAQMPKCLFTDPELAEVGLSEAEATRRFRGRMRIVRQSFALNDRAGTERDTEGVAKLVCDQRGRLLGASIAGARAGELIGILTLALENKLSVHELATFAAPYPSRAEIINRLSEAFLREGSAGRAQRRLALGRMLP